MPIAALPAVVQSQGLILSWPSAGSHPLPEYLPSIDTSFCVPAALCAWECPKVQLIDQYTSS